MARLVVTADADADTAEILTYLERVAGKLVAARYAHRFRDTLERLVDLPETGAPRQRLGPNVRIAVVFPYVLIHETRATTKP